MRKFLFTTLILLCSQSYSQYNGYIVKGNDTIDVKFKTEELTVRSFLKIEALQTKVKYEYNGETITAKPGDIDSFCIKSNGKRFCFDSFFSDKDNKGTFLFRVFGKKKDKMTIYQFYGSGFIGVNFSVRLGYLAKRENKEDLFLSLKTAKQWKDFLLKLVEDCPTFHNYILNDVEKITFEDEFENYLNQYKERCYKKQ